MTTQRDRLAAILTEGLADLDTPQDFGDFAPVCTPREYADALIARGVRVIPPGYWQVDGDLTPDDIAMVRKCVEEADGRTLIVAGRYTLRWRDFEVVTPGVAER